MWKKVVLFRKKHALALFGLSTVILLSGCNTGNGKNEESGEKKTLKVIYYDERSFFDQFGMLYSALHPEVEIEVVSTQEVKYDPQKDMSAEMMKFIEKQNADVVYLDTNQFKKLAPEGKLLEIDTMVEEEKFHKETLVPGLLDYIKELGGGKLYGLTPSFYSQVLYYNKDVFKKYNVPMPTDKMTWEKLLELAQRFPTEGAKEERVYGLSLGYFSDPYQFGNMIGSSQNLNIMNANMQVTINTPGWQKAFDLAFRALKSGAMHVEDPNSNSMESNTYEDYLLRDPLISGKVAMKIEGDYYMGQIKEAQKAIPDKAVKEWDMVTMPVDPQFPDSSPLVSLSSIFAVNAKSANVEEAKKFIQYVTSEEYARVTSKLQRGSLSVRTNFYDDKDGHNMKAFYALKPMENPMNALFDKLPKDFFMQFTGIAQSEIKSAYDGQKSLEEALNETQTKGQAALLQAQQDEKNGKPAATNAKPSA